MKLDKNTGQLYFKEKDITPPKLFSKEWEGLLKSTFPDLKISHSDYHQFVGISISNKSLKILNYYELDVEIGYVGIVEPNSSGNLQFTKPYELKGFTINFSSKFLDEIVFENKKMKYNEKLKLVKQKHIELLERLTNMKLEISNKNHISLSDWGNAILGIKKGKFYVMHIFWK